MQFNWFSICNVPRSIFLAQVGRYFHIQNNTEGVNNKINQGDPLAKIAFFSPLK